MFDEGEPPMGLAQGMEPSREEEQQTVLYEHRLDSLVITHYDDYLLESALGIYPSLEPWV